MIIGTDLTRYYGLGAVQVRALDGVSLKIQFWRLLKFLSPINLKLSQGGKGKKKVNSVCYCIFIYIYMYVQRRP